MKRQGPDLCGECGANPAYPLPGARCRVCGAAPTVWEAVPVGFWDWVGRAFGALLLAVSALACWLAAGLFLYAWMGESTTARVLQVLLGLIVVPGGAVVGYTLFLAVGDTLRGRTWRTGDRDGPAFAEAVFAGARLDRASGWVRRMGPPLTFDDPTVSSATALTALPALRRTLLTGRSFPRGTPGTVDLLVLMALVRMVRAGQIALSTELDRSWNVGTIPAPRPTRWKVALSVRAGPRPAPPADPIEAVVLDGLREAAPVAAPGEGATPYRSSAAAVPREGSEAPWCPLEEVLALGARAYASPRRALRDQVREATRRDAPADRDEAVAQATEAFSAAFAVEAMPGGFAVRVFDACAVGLRRGLRA